MEIITNLKSQRWGSESSRMDGLTDTRVFKQVAMAKLSRKQNPTASCWLLVVYIGGRQLGGCWGRNPNLKRPPSGLDEIQGTQPTTTSLIIVLSILKSSGGISE
jgi:hypothetical protein